MRKLVYTNNGNMNIYASICFQSCNANGYPNNFNTIYFHPLSDVRMRVQIAYPVNSHECRNCFWDRYFPNENVKIHFV